MRANPVAGYSDTSQFYFKDQYISQMGSIDSEGNRLIDQDGVMGLDDSPYKITFQMDLTPENLFYNNQTSCGHYDGNDESFNG